MLDENLPLSRAAQQREDNPPKESGSRRRQWWWGAYICGEKRVSPRKLGKLEACKAERKQKGQQRDDGLTIKVCRCTN